MKCYILKIACKITQKKWTNQKVSPNSFILVYCLRFLALRRCSGEQSSESRLPVIV